MMNPTATIIMQDDVEFQVELYPDKAPETVDNFIKLAGGGFYDGLIFHRIIPGFVLQGGDPEGTGMGGPGYCIKGEFAANGHEGNDLSHQVGVLSMARARSFDSAGSQFFIVVGDASFLDGQYAAFGKVNSQNGIDYCLKLAGTPTGVNDRPVDPPVIKSIRIDKN